MDAKLKSRERARYHSNRVSSFKCDNSILACAIQYLLSEEEEEEEEEEGVAFCVYRHTSDVAALRTTSTRCEQSFLNSSSSSSSSRVCVCVCVHTHERDKFRPWRDTHHGLWLCKWFFFLPSLWHSSVWDLNAGCLAGWLGPSLPPARAME